MPWPPVPPLGVAPDLKPPAPWDTAAPETLRLIGRYKVDGRDVSAFSRPLADGEDARVEGDLVGVQAASQITAPASIAGHKTGRAWKMRAAFQDMPQATNSSALGTLAGTAPVCAPIAQRLIAKAPTR